MPPVTDFSPSFLDALHDLSDSLQDRGSTAAQDIAACGPVVLQLLTTCSNDIRDRTRGDQPRESGGPADDVPVVLDTLVKLAKENIDSVPFNMVNRHWLRLYTDASLLWSMSDLVIGPPVAQKQGQQRFWLRASRRLDMAIIIAGALGENRMAWIQTVIKSVQTHIAHPLDGTTDKQDARPTKKARTERSPVRSAQDRLLFAASPIPEFEQAPSISRYLRILVDKPFIVRGNFVGSHTASPAWPALTKWSQASYLLQSVGEGRVVPVEIGGSYDDKGWGQRIVSFRRFLRRAGFEDLEESADSDEETAFAAEGVANDSVPAAIDSSHHSADTSVKPMYLAQHSLFEQFPDLARDISYPDYVWSNPPVPSTCLDYHPPETDDGVIVNAWVGSGSGEIISPAHTDPFYNCYAQVLGEKRVWLAPPTCTPFMASYGLASESHTTDDASLAEQYMTNTSQIPLLRPVDDFQALKGEHPQFFEHVWPVSMEAVLSPGDLLIMPPGWWHAMRGEGNGPGWSVSMWY